jgi:membrane-bound ClpP family serine protease
MESRAFTEGKAIGASPPLIDLVAADIPELLKKLQGRTITRFDGSSLVLRTDGARVVLVTMSLRSLSAGPVNVLATRANRLTR